MARELPHSTEAEQAILGAMLAVSATLSPFATAAALRISLH